MSILSLLLILVLPIDALIVSCPSRCTIFQGSRRGMTSCLPQKAMSPPNNWDGGCVDDRGIAWKSLDHSGIDQMVHQKDAVVEAFSTGFVATAAELPNESKLRELFSTILGRLEQNPELVTIGAAALVVLVLVTLNNPAAKSPPPPTEPQQKQIMTPVNGEGHTAVDLEQAVAGLSQSVVVLTNEIKAIKDSEQKVLGGTQKLVELQRQNEELQRELETTKVKAQTLTETHTVLNLGVQESSIISKEQPSFEEEVNSHRGKAFFVDEKENGAPRGVVNGEGKKDVSDLFLIAMGLGFLITIFSGM